MPYDINIHTRSMDTFKSILETQGIYLTKAIYRNLDLMSKYPERHTHVAFLLDDNNNVLSYKPNVYFKTEKYPFSQHAEVATINNYYSKRLNNLKQTAKTLLVIRIKSQSFGESRPCKDCSNFILNNWSNLKLKRVIYSGAYSTFTSIKKNDLLMGKFYAPTSTMQ